MSFDSAIFTVLSTDTTLLDIATGGVYLYTNLGKYGFSHVSPTAKPAWDKNGMLLPSIVVRSRNETPDNIIRDTESQFVSTRGIVEVWIYQNGDLPSDPLETISKRIYTLLQDKNIVGLGTVRLSNKLENFRDPSLEFALAWRRDFQIFSADKGN